MTHAADDFEAVIRIFSAEEGGRRTPAVNGIRWDFAYADDGPDPPMLFMIWPDFYAACDRPLSVGVELPARMRVVADDLRAVFHWHRVAPGVRFFCHEGPKRVALGTVTRITGLFRPMFGAACATNSPT